MAECCDNNYDRGYEDGFDDAFESRTYEAMALVRSFWRKLSLARRQRDIILKGVANQYDEPEIVVTLAGTLAETERRLRDAELMVVLLRQELQRTQRLAATPFTEFNPMRIYGTFTSWGGGRYQ